MGSILDLERILMMLFSSADPVSRQPLRLKPDGDLTEQFWTIRIGVVHESLTIVKYNF